MAKKDLSKLVGGIIGDTPTQETKGRGDLDHGVAEAMGITPDMEAQLNALRRQNTGRPRGTGRKEKSNEIRATFVVDPDLVRKVKYISLAEGRLHKDVIGEALSRYISEWEEQNGTINLPKL